MLLNKQLRVTINLQNTMELKILWSLNVLLPTFFQISVSVFNKRKKQIILRGEQSHLNLYFALKPITPVNCSIFPLLFCITFVWLCEYKVSAIEYSDDIQYIAFIYDLAPS